MKEKLLLLGQQGQLGTEWRYLFERRDIPFEGTDSRKLDITDRSKVDEVFDAVRPDYVINCAAYTNVDGAEDEQEKAMSVNKDGARHLAEASARHNAMLIHYSTDYIFPGKQEDQNTFPRGYHEEASVDPVNVYGRTKYEGEQEIRKAWDKHIILRTSWLNGVYGHNFIKTMLKLSRNKDEIKVVNDQFGSPAYTSNIVRNTIALMQNGFQGTVHLSSGGLINWYELASEVMRLTGAKTKVNPVTTKEFGARAPRPYFSKLDTGLIRNFEGSRIISWQEGLQHMLRDPRLNID